DNPQRFVRCCTQACWKAEFVRKLASFGSFVVISVLLLVTTPLPASGNHCQSWSACWPYFAIEKLESLAWLGPSLVVQPIMGIVSIAFAPPFLLAATKSSAAAPGVFVESARLSKYQSAA